MIQNLFRATSFVALIGLAVYTTSCGSSGNTENADSTQVQQSAPISFDKIINDVPKPTEIPALLQRSGVDFVPSLTNPADRSQNYLTTNSIAALNLGIYTTDLGYLCSFSKSEEAIAYFKASQQLANKLGITGAFETSLMERFQKNLANKDSLVILVEKSTEVAKVFLNENQQYNVAAMMVTGSFIEGLHLATTLVDSFPAELKGIKDQVLVDLVRTVLEQKKGLGDIIKVLEPIEATDAQAKELLASLRPLYQKYEDLKVEEKIQQNQGNLMFKAEDLKEITIAIKELRYKIVG
ncbi:MAG: hypothetical protein OHK0038_27790 [Flammeovirgaceae bacterium]